MKYLVQLSAAALRDLESLDGANLKKIRRTLEEKLGTDPHMFGKPLRHALRGTRSLRVGDWRVTYAIRDKTVYVTAIFHRREGYD